MDFDKLDISDGFVLSQGKALAYLKYCTGEMFAQAMQKGALGIDPESAGTDFTDMVAMAQTIVDDDWAWVLFYEQPMSACGMGIKEMKEA